MLMRSPGYALSWEYWCRGVFWFVPGCAALVVGLLSPAYYVLGDGPEVRASLSIASFAATWWIAIVFAMASRKSLRRLYALPLSTQSLVSWPLANGILAVLATYYLTALSINTLFYPDWSLIVPAWWAVAIYVAFQTTVWSIERGLLAVPVVAFALLVLYSSGRGFFDGLVASGGGSLSRASAGLAVDLGGPFVVAVCFYLVSLYAVRRARHGEAWSMAWLSPDWWKQRRTESPAPTIANEGPLAVHRFRSPYSAQLWMEWRARGRYLPLAVAALLGCLWIGFRSDAQGLSEAFGGLTSTALLFSPLVGLFLGHRSDRFDMKSFLGTRPLPDGDMAMAVLGNAAVAIGASALVWLVGGLGILAAYRYPAPIPDWRLIPTLLLLAWTFTGLGVAVGLARSRFVATVGVGAGVLLVLFFCIMHTSRGHDIRVALFATLAACSFVGTALAFIAAIRRHILGTRTLIGCLAGYIIVSAWCLFIWGWGAPKISLGHAIVFGFCTLPFAPIAAAPLALFWNRHR